MQHLEGEVAHAQHLAPAHHQELRAPPVGGCSRKQPIDLVLRHALAHRQDADGCDPGHRPKPACVIGVLVGDHGNVQMEQAGFHRTPAAPNPRERMHRQGS